MTEAFGVGLQPCVLPGLRGALAQHLANPGSPLASLDPNLVDLPGEEGDGQPIRQIRCRKDSGAIDLREPFQS